MNSRLILILLAGTTFLYSSFYSLPYDTPKVLFFRVFLSLLLLIWGIRVVTKREVEVSLPPKKPMWIFAGIAVINLLVFLNSIDMLRSFWGSYFRYQGIYVFAHYGLFVLLVLGTLKKEDFKFFEKFFAIALLVLAFVSFYQFFIVKSMYYFGRIHGLFGNPLYLAQIIVLLLPVLLSSFLIEKNKIIWIFTIALSVFMLFLTGTRAAMIGAFVGIFFYAILYGIKNRSALLRNLMIGLVALAVLFVVIFNIFANEDWVKQNRILRRFTPGPQDSVYSVSVRLEIWKSTMPLIKDYAALGSGQDTFDLPFGEYASAVLKENKMEFADRAHNIVLDLLAMYGVFGLLVYVGFIALIFIHGIRFFMRSEDKVPALRVLGIMSGFVSLIVALQFSFFAFINHVYFWFLVAFLLVLVAPHRKKIVFKLSSGVEFLLIVLLTAIFIGNIVFLNLYPELENLYWMFV